MGITIDQQVIVIAIQSFDGACQTRLGNRLGLARLLETGGTDQASEATGQHGRATYQHDQADGDDKGEDKTILGNMFMAQKCCLHGM